MLWPRRLACEDGPAVGDVVQGIYETLVGVLCSVHAGFAGLALHPSQYVRSIILLRRFAAVIVLLGVLVWLPSCYASNATGPTSCGAIVLLSGEGCRREERSTEESVFQ